MPMTVSVAKIMGARGHRPLSGTYFPTLQSVIQSARFFSKRIGKEIELQRKQKQKKMV